MKAILTATIITLTILTGCQTRLDKDVALMPAVFGQGYKDGCSSGYVAAGHPYYQYQKNFNMYSTNTEYKEGWQEGYDRCKSQYLVIRGKSNPFR